jgi:hypothetical protein
MGDGKDRREGGQGHAGLVRERGGRREAWRLNIDGMKIGRDRRTAWKKRKEGRKDARKREKEGRRAKGCPSNHAHTHVYIYIYIYICMHCVLCIVYCVLCIVYCVLLCMMYDV